MKTGTVVCESGTLGEGESGQVLTKICQPDRIFAAAGLPTAATLQGS
jgi:hypothetical protein